MASEIVNLMGAGVRVIACRECADSYGVTETLTAMGIEVFFTGKLLTDWLKGDRRIISF